MRVVMALMAMWISCDVAHARRASKPAVPTASGAPSRRYWIERIEINGMPDEGARALFRERVWNAVELVLANDGQEVVPVPEIERAVAESPDARACRDLSCRVALAERLKAARALSVVIEQRSDERTRSAWTVTWDIFAIDALENVIHKEVTCSSCSDAQTLDTVISSFPTVLSEQRPVQTCRARIDTVPSGADVEVDGARVGKTPFDRTVSAHAHEVTISRTGFSPSKVSLRCDPGRREALSLRLVRDRALIADEREERAPTASSTGAAVHVELARPVESSGGSSVKRTALLATGGVSLVLCAASAALLGVGLAFDGRTDTEGGRPFSYDTQGAVILGGVGVGVFGALGIGLVVAGARTRVSR